MTTMMKTLLEILLCLHLTSVNAANDFYQGQFQSSNVVDGNSYVSGGSNSVFQSNGNTVVINRRMGPNNEEDNVVTVSNPNVKIDGDYCKMNFMKTANEFS